MLTMDNDEDDVLSACTEENELLSATSIKMSEAPFGRSDSEDDIVEDYDDIISFQTPCFRGRTGLEKVLLVCLLLALVTIIGLAVGLTRPQVLPVTKYCKLPPCVQASSSVMSTIDWSVDPCKDFFQFSCGHWLRTTPIPRGYQHWDRFQELSGNNLYVLSELIESNVPTSPSFHKTKDFYHSCMAVTPDRRDSVLQQFSALVEENGGWSNSKNDTYDQWDYMAALEFVHSHGAWPLFRLTVEVDERDPTLQNIIKIDIGETVLPSDLKPFINKTDHPRANSSSGDDKYTPHSIKDEEKLRQVFLDETVHLFTSFGMTVPQATKRADDMMALEEIIMKASQGYHHIHDRFSLYNVRTVALIQHKYPMVNWIQYLNALGFQVDGETEVVILHPDYLAKLTVDLRDYYDGPEEKQRIMRDYLAISLIRSFKPYFDKSVFELTETEDSVIEEPWKRCTFYTNRALSFSTGALYVKGTKSEDSVQKIEKLIIFVRNAFKDYLLKKYWMDRKTIRRAEEKVDAIIDKISYPSYILNITFLDEYYENLMVTDDWFSNLLSWRRFLLAHTNKELKAVPDRKTSWLRPPVTVNAYYSATRNDVIFPIAMFHLPFYIPDGPSAVNFGAMGSIIGHEITHAFDFQGRQYDGQGKLSDWWDERTAANFEITTTCMKDQYNDIKVKGAHIDGDFTLDENIADNGGLRAAVYAYQMWIDKYGEEMRLPGLNLTMYQVLFTSYAQMFCSKWTDAGLLLHLLRDPHSPGVARVNGVMSNSQTFNWAFQCPLDSPMNPRIKCQVW